MESTKRLEKQISRLNVVAAAAAPAEAEGTGAPKLRHDPRSTGGTFWRTRKEKKARTVFLGGIPAHFTKEQITDFILTILDSNEAAAPYLEEKGSSSAVEEIDVIGHRPQGKIQNLYVTMASVGLAGCCIAGLDGYRLAGKNLRCNFSSDKSQRALAIKNAKSRGD
ncbi:RNA binding protein [Angomonas deanei]|nr:RNA binding protein [Angomonas deanei]|eukprot:EPY43191.1 RNA binding protein [Angomonas deanei]